MRSQEVDGSTLLFVAMKEQAAPARIGANGQTPQVIHGQKRRAEDSSARLADSTKAAFLRLTLGSRRPYQS